MGQIEDVIVRFIRSNELYRTYFSDKDEKFIEDWFVNNVDYSVSQICYGTASCDFD